MIHSKNEQTRNREKRCLVNVFNKIMYKIMLPHIQCLAADKPIGKKKKTLFHNHTALEYQQTY